MQKHNKVEQISQICLKLYKKTNTKIITHGTKQVNFVYKFIKKTCRNVNKGDSILLKILKLTNNFSTKLTSFMPIMVFLKFFLKI